MRRVLTDALIRATSPPAAGRVELADTRCAGLVLRVTPGGVRTWSFRFRDPTTKRLARVSIGPYPAVTLATAREKAEDYRREVAKGGNPIERQRRERNEAPLRTFTALATRYITHAENTKRSHAADKWAVEKYLLPTWGKRAVASIERKEVVDFIGELVKAGKPVLANRIHALISRIFSYGLNAGLSAHHPALRLERQFEETTRKRTLSDDELRLFWPRIIQSPVSLRVGLALRLILLTACRPGEVAGMTQSELVDLDKPDKASWIIPIHRLKRYRLGKDISPHQVPLSPMALGIIRQLRELSGSEHLFPGHGSDGPMSGHTLAVAMARFGKGLKADKGDAAARSWKADRPTPHDLRRTATTRLSSLGVPSDDLAEILNHTRQDITNRVYNQYDREKEKRAALDLWAVTLAAILQPPAATVVPMRGQQR